VAIEIHTVALMMRMRTYGSLHPSFTQSIGTFELLSLDLEVDGHLVAFQADTEAPLVALAKKFQIGGLRAGKGEATGFGSGRRCHRPQEDLVVISHKGIVETYYPRTLSGDEEWGPSESPMQRPFSRVCGRRLGCPEWLNISARLLPDPHHGSHPSRLQVMAWLAGSETDETFLGDW